MAKTIRKTAALLIAALNIGILAGCSDATIGGDSMLRPPRATGDKAAIQDIIAAEAGGSYSLKYPQQGENRSAITLRNENTDNEYAVALYSTENDTKLNVSIIACIKKEWKCLGTFSNNNSGVDRVMFYDIKGSVNEGIVIGWTSYNSSQKTLTSYSFNSEEASELNLEESYDEMSVGDMTGDGSDELLLLSLSSQDVMSHATLVQYSGEDKRLLSKYSVELDPSVISFSNIAAGEIVSPSISDEEYAAEPEKDGEQDEDYDEDEDETMSTSTGARSVRAEPSVQTSRENSGDTQSSVKEKPDNDNSKTKASKTEVSKTENTASSDKSDVISETAEPSGDPDASKTSKAGSDTKQESSAGAAASSSPPETAEVSDEKSSASAQPASSSQVTSSSSQPVQSSVPQESSDASDEDDPEYTDTDPDESSEAEGSQSSAASDKREIILNRRGVAVDGKRGDETFCTQIIYYDSKRDQLVNPLAGKTDGSGALNPTLRSDAVFSADINNDGVIDVPTVAPMFASAEESGAAVCNMTVWNNYDPVTESFDKLLVPVMNTVINSKDGYYFVMPERWIGKVTARSDPETREMTFYLWDEDKSRIGDKLLTLFRYTEQQWSNTPKQGFIRLELGRDQSNACFAAKIYESKTDKSMNIKKQEVRDSVFPI